MLKKLALNIGLFFTLLALLTVSVEAATTTPRTMSYQGRLMDNSNNVLTSEHVFRFSFWSDADFDAGDLNEDGSINTSATGYANWIESHTVTPNADGLFTLSLGSVTPLPAIDYNLHKYLQVEVKLAGAPNTSYEVLDPDGDNSNLTDRKAIEAVPYAMNADTLDGYDVGTGSGSIALLGANGQWSASQMPGATNESTFAIDNLGASATPTLQFGSSLTRYFRWNNAESRFEISDNTYIAGNLIVEGTLNANIEVGGTTSNTFRVNSDGDVASEDTVIRFGDGAEKTLTWDYSESIFNFSDPVSIAGSPIITEASLDWDDLPARAKSLSFAVEYPDAGFKPDGSNNIGVLSVEEDTLNKRLYYKWYVTESTSNDYDIVLRVQVPQDFSAWSATAMNLAYQTSSASLANNDADVTVYDTAGSEVTLTGGSDLYSASWASANIVFTDGTFTAGSYFTIVIKGSAKDSNSVHLSDLTLNYMGR
ncbi:MAG: hypothetical protein PHU71_02990 [Candidatus Gracilibacteria bacterium]|nr:hypothetical protein [Candidatus Gracilibacteria bacterium]